MVLGRARSCSVRVGQRERVGLGCLGIRDHYRVREQFFIIIGRLLVVSIVLDDVDFEFFRELVVVRDRHLDERVAVELLLHVDRDLDFLFHFHSLLVVTGSKQLVVVIVSRLFDFSLVDVVEQQQRVQLAHCFRLELYR